MSLDRLNKMLRKCEKRYESINPKCQVARARVLKKAESIQHKIDAIKE